MQSENDVVCAEGGDMSLFPELEGQPVNDLMRALGDPTSQKAMEPEDRAVWLQEAAVRIGECRPKGINFLLSLVPRANIAQLRAVLLGLSMAGRRLSQR